MKTESIPTLCHFTTGDYLHIKTSTGNYAMKMDGKTPRDAALAHYAETKLEFERLNRRLDAMAAFINGETVSHPDALRA